MKKVPRFRKTPVWHALPQEQGKSIIFGENQHNVEHLDLMSDQTLPESRHQGLRTAALDGPAGRWQTTTASRSKWSLPSSALIRSKPVVHGGNPPENQRGEKLKFSTENFDKKKSRFADSQIMDALKWVESGLAEPGVCRGPGISVPTCYKWRAKFGGANASLMARMKELEGESRLLKEMHVHAKVKPNIAPRHSQKCDEAISLARNGQTQESRSWSVHQGGLPGVLGEPVVLRYATKTSASGRAGSWCVRSPCP